MPTPLKPLSTFYWDQVDSCGHYCQVHVALTIFSGEGSLEEYLGRDTSDATEPEFMKSQSYAN